MYQSEKDSKEGFTMLLCILKGIFKKQVTVASCFQLTEFFSYMQIVGIYLHLMFLVFLSQICSLLRQNRKKEGLKEFFSKLNLLQIVVCLVLVGYCVNRCNLTSFSPIFLFLSFIKRSLHNTVFLRKTTVFSNHTMCSIRYPMPMVLW